MTKLIGTAFCVLAAAALALWIWTAYRRGDLRTEAPMIEPIEAEPYFEPGPGGPILVVTSPESEFGRYYGQILLAEGLNEYRIADIAEVDATKLSQHQVVILTEMSLTAPQVQTLTTWVNGGGNLIAMRPDPQLSTLLGLKDAGGSLSEGYLRVDSATAPGLGIVDETIQFHGDADRYTLDGATEVAALYEDATTPSGNPAVTVREVGSDGGQAAAFTYDLARSIVYTRQGNPAWANKERDGFEPIRANDMFFPDWIDFDKVQIPQADEQQRLLANVIHDVTLDEVPLPRFWYFPSDYKAVVVMTGDDHAGGGGGSTVKRFRQYLAQSPSDGSLDDWEMVRGSSYVFLKVDVSDAEAAAFDRQGFEIGLHLTTRGKDAKRSRQEELLREQLTAFSARWPSLPRPTTIRTHAIAWGDGYTTHAEVLNAYGFRMDLNFYYWPPSWIIDRPGIFTGSAMPMRFAREDGTILDIFQVATQMTDESEQSYPRTIDTLLDNALGSKGYYGAFTINAHNDEVVSHEADAVIRASLDRGVPIITAQQLLTWTDGRNDSSFDQVSWDSATSELSFQITVGTGANNLRAMVPSISHSGSLASVLRDGNPVSHSVQEIKGVEYAFFDAQPGSYVVAYAPGGESL